MVSGVNALSDKRPIVKIDSLALSSIKVLTVVFSSVINFLKCTRERFKYSSKATLGFTGIVIAAKTPAIVG